MDYPPESPHVITERALGSGPGARYWRMRYEKLPESERPRVIVTRKVGKRERLERVVGTMTWADAKTIFVKTHDKLIEIKRNDKLHSLKVEGNM